jgi:hypothetical protein
MFNIFEELTWPQFSQLPNVVKLSLNEQVIQYNQYLFELSEARISWLEYQNKGPQSNVMSALAQEESYINIDYQFDYYNILQEDGSLIYVTK